MESMKDDILSQDVEIAENDKKATNSDEQNRIEILLSKIQLLIKTFNKANHLQERGLQLEKFQLYKLYIENKQLQLLQLQTKRLLILKKAIHFIYLLQAYRIQIIQSVDSFDNLLRQARQRLRNHQDIFLSLHSRKGSNDQEFRTRRKPDTEEGLSPDQIFILRRVRAQESFKDQKKILSVPLAQFTTLIEGAGNDVASFSRIKLTGELGDTENATETSQMESVGKENAIGKEVIENVTESIEKAENISHQENEEIQKPMMSNYKDIAEGQGRGQEVNVQD